MKNLSTRRSGQTMSSVVCGLDATRKPHTPWYLTPTRARLDDSPKPTSIGAAKIKSRRVKFPATAVKIFFSANTLLLGNSSTPLGICQPKTGGECSRGATSSPRLRRRLREWLETQREDNETRLLFTEVRRNFNSIKKDIGLYLILAKRLSARASR